MNSDIVWIILSGCFAILGCAGRWSGVACGVMAELPPASDASGLGASGLGAAGLGASGLEASADAEPAAAALGEVVSRAAAGEALAWRELVDAYAARVYGLLVARCHDADLAEELTQDTFARLAERLGRGDVYEERGRFEPWLFRIALNRLRDEARRQKRHARSMDMTPGGRTAQHADDAGGEWAAMQSSSRKPTGEAHVTHDPHDAAATGEAVAILRHAVASMSEKDREILHLRHTAGLSFTEIADALGEPQGTVLARGHRALKKLRTLLTEKGVTQA